MRNEVLFAPIKITDVFYGRKLPAGLSCIDYNQTKVVSFDWKVDTQKTQLLLSEDVFRSKREERKISKFLEHSSNK